MWTVRRLNTDQTYYRWFLPAFGFRIFFALLFAVAYVIILSGGGDTIAYHDGAYHLTQLFWDSPIAYFQEMISTPSHETITYHFNEETGYPPSWIYAEAESFFVCKLVSVLSLFTFNSYIALTLLCATFSFLAAWRLYSFIRTFNFCPQWVIVVAVLFVPTVAFWTTGVGKDVFVVSAFYWLLADLFPVVTGKKQVSFRLLLWMALMIFILYHLRSFMIVAVALPLFIALMARLGRRISNNTRQLAAFRILIGGIVIFSLFAFLQFSNFTQMIETNPYLQEVAVIQKDFAQNKNYSGTRYDLGITEYNAWGLLKAAPLSVFTSFYRPLPWEADSAFLLISALENILLLLLTVRFFFFSGNLREHFKFIRSQEFLVFAILFSLILGFLVGFTSGLFNVLVRFKAPFVGLLFIFLAASEKHLKAKNNKRKVRKSLDIQQSKSYMGYL